MKKKILSLALAAMALISLNAAAQQPQNCSPNNCGQQYCAQQPCTPQQNCNQPGCNPQNCAPGKQCAVKPQGPDFFAGINLTADQKTKLEAISTPCQVMAVAQKNGAERNFNHRDYLRTVRADYLKQVRNVLTPDQYVQFLENFYVSSPGAGARPDKARHHGKKDFRRPGGKGRCQRPAPQQQTQNGK